MTSFSSRSLRRARALVAAWAVLALTSTLAAGPALAGGSSPVRFLAEAGPAKPTKAWVRFCNDMPEACSVGLLEPRVIPHTSKFWVDLVEVNTSVNRQVTAVTDRAQWGVSDRWDFPDTGAGDCEDIQIEKRRRLIQLGYPAKAMRMAVVINPEGEGHAVLLVRSDKGDFVLDNRTDAVLPWFAARYTWVKREPDDGSDRWVALGGLRSPIETAGDGK